MSKPLILLVEDQPEDREMTRLALELGRIPCEVDVVADSDQMSDYVLSSRAAQRVPQLILIDLDRFKLSRLQLPKLIRRARWDRNGYAPVVVVFSSSENEEDVREAYRCGAHGYVFKPSRLEPFVRKVQRMVVYWLFVNEPPPSLRKTMADRPREEAETAVVPLTRTSKTASASVCPAGV